MDDRLKAYWTQPARSLFGALVARPEGLAAKEAASRMERYGPNRPMPHRERATLQLLLRQLANPLVLILAFAAAVALVVQDWLDGAIILAILLGSVLLSFFQERRASRAMERLQRRAVVHARVLRDGRAQELPAAAVVPGRALIVYTGRATAFGAIAERLAARAPETEFERGCGTEWRTAAEF